MGQDSTCWGLLRDAASGDESARAAFVVRYAPVVRSYLGVRWRGTKWLREFDDAVQDVFFECLKSGGLLASAQSERPGGFRAFLYGSVRNVALRVETQGTRRRVREALDAGALEAAPSRDEALSRVFDRAWARSVVRQAAERQAELAAQRGAAALRRVELLRLRFHEGMPIREIAQLWGVEAAPLHHEYARARQEFRAALAEVVAAVHDDASPGEVDRECAKLLSLLE